MSSLPPHSGLMAFGSSPSVPFGFVVAKSLGPRTSSITPSNSSLEFTSPDRSLLWVDHCRTAGFVAENQAATSLSCAVTI